MENCSKRYHRRKQWKRSLKRSLRVWSGPDTRKVFGKRSMPRRPSFPVCSAGASISFSKCSPDSRSYGNHYASWSRRVVVDSGCKACSTLGAGMTNIYFKMLLAGTGPLEYQGSNSPATHNLAAPLGVASIRPPPATTASEIFGGWLLSIPIVAEIRHR